MSDKPIEKVPTWVYNKKTGEGEIKELKEGAKPPAGFVFSPAECDVKDGDSE